MAIKEKWSKRALERQIKSALFERSVLNPVKVSPVVSQTHPDALNIFKDSYLQKHCYRRSYMSFICKMHRMKRLMTLKADTIATMQADMVCIGSPARPVNPHIE